MPPSYQCTVDESLGTYSCPSQSCTYSSSVAVSGPGGCANANGWISINTVGQTSFSYLSTYLEQEINEFCAGYEGVGQAAVSIAQAFSYAVARVYGNWVQYACTAPTHKCCTRGQAYNNVKGDGVAVAAAIAYAFTEARSKILSTQTDSCAAALANAFAASSGFAADTQLAVLKVPASYISNPPMPGYCSTNAVQSMTRCEFASAFTCAVARVLTSVSADPTPDSGSCSDSVAISGIRSDASLVCPNMCYQGQVASGPGTGCVTDPNSGSISCTYSYSAGSDLTISAGDQITMLSPEATPKDPVCPVSP
eukprot:jgi/Chrzof1/6241/Cz17g17040.t1